MTLKRTILAAGALATSVLWLNGAMAQPTEEQQKLVQENFRQADANEDKALDRDELEAFIRANADDEIGNAKRVVRMGMFDRAFKRLDKDKNGLVTIEEIREENK